MRDTGEGHAGAAVLGVEDAGIAEALAQCGYTVESVDSPRANAVVARTVAVAEDARARGLPFLLDARCTGARTALLALGAPEHAYATFDDLRRRLAVLGRRGWAVSSQPPIVHDLVQQVCELRLWLEGLRQAEVEAQRAHAESTAATERHIEGLERQRAALEEHREVLLARVDELATAHDALAARLRAIEGTRAWRTAAALKRHRERLTRRWARR